MLRPCAARADTRCAAHSTTPGSNSGSCACGDGACSRCARCRGIVRTRSCRACDRRARHVYTGSRSRRCPGGHHRCCAGRATRGRAASGFSHDRQRQRAAGPRSDIHGQRRQDVGANRQPTRDVVTRYAVHGRNQVRSDEQHVSRARGPRPRDPRARRRPIAQLFAVQMLFEPPGFKQVAVVAVGITARLLRDVDVIVAR
jgi:hypothetical protein